MFDSNLPTAPNALMHNPVPLLTVEVQEAGGAHPEAEVAADDQAPCLQLVVLQLEPTVGAMGHEVIMLKDCGI